jgi:hypothetical protein
MGELDQYETAMLPTGERKEGKGCIRWTLETLMQRIDSHAVGFSSRRPGSLFRHRRYESEIIKIWSPVRVMGKYRSTQHTAMCVGISWERVVPAKGDGRSLCHFTCATEIKSLRMLGHPLFWARHQSEREPIANSALWSDDASGSITSRAAQRRPQNSFGRQQLPFRLAIFPAKELASSFGISPSLKGRMLAEKEETGEREDASWWLPPHVDGFGLPLIDRFPPPSRCKFLPRQSGRSEKPWPRSCCVLVQIELFFTEIRARSAGGYDRPDSLSFPCSDADADPDGRMLCRKLAWCLLVAWPDRTVFVASVILGCTLRTVHIRACKREPLCWRLGSLKQADTFFCGSPLFFQILKLQVQGIYTLLPSTLWLCNLCESCSTWLAQVYLQKAWPRIQRYNDEPHNWKMPRRVRSGHGFSKQTINRICGIDCIVGCSRV